MENRHKEANPLCMNFTKVKHVFVGSTWKRYKNFPIDGANGSGVLFAQNLQDILT